MKTVNLETITDMQLWCKTWPLNGVDLTRVKQKLLRRWKGVYESFSNHQKSRESFTVTIHCNLANLVKIFHGIIKLLHPIDPRRMALLKERYAE